MPVIGLVIRWWDAGEGSVEGAQPPPQVNNIFLYTGSVVRVSASSSFIAVFILLFSHFGYYFNKRLLACFDLISSLSK